MNAKLPVVFQPENKIQTVPFIPVDSSEQLFTPSQLVTADEIIETAKHIIVKRMERGHLFTDVKASKEYALIHCADHTCEYFSVLFLDSKHRLIRHDVMFRGSIDGAAVPVREVVRDTLLVHNAAAVIFIHNHPSGDPEPSKADLQLTQRLVEVLALVNVKVLDHLIVGSDEVVSLAEQGEV